MTAGSSSSSADVKKAGAAGRRWDSVIGATMGVLAFGLYVRTLAPSVAFIFDDTLELQYVVPRLGIIHQTGYPLYALLGKLFTLLVPLNDPAFRLNLFSALMGALAVGMMYLVLRHLLVHRWAAIVGAATFAVGQTFWSQAVIAETYTTQMLIVAGLLYLALVWREEVEQGSIGRARVRFYGLAFLVGIGLTHHRLIILLYPALLVYIVLVLRSAGADFRRLGMFVRAAILLVLPLVLYLYLPLRGAVGSADGEYVNTLQGFWAWIMAQQYTVFLTGNPLQVQRDAAYYISLFMAQFGSVGLALAAVGVVWMLRRPREFVLLALALIFEAGFAFNYRVENVYVHFLTTFLLLAAFVGAGADGLLTVISDFGLKISDFKPAVAAMALLLALMPIRLVQANYVRNDLANKWDVHDYGIEILSQPLEKNSTIIGILGEMTLVRYFQENLGLRPDVQTVAADQEDARLAAVDRALAENRTVYLTRVLKGIGERYSLSSQGPLIRVHAQPTDQTPRISHPLRVEFGSTVRLLGYDLDQSQLEAVPGQWHAENGRWLNVTLYWQVLDKVQEDAMVSLKVLGPDQHAVGQVDRRPVLGAYPTTQWRAGEVITDTYAVPIFLGAPAGSYDLQVTMYDAASGATMGQTSLAQVALPGDMTAPRRAEGPNPRDEVWNVNRTSEADFGAFSLAGYSLDAEGPVQPGNALPLTLLWHAGDKPIPDGLVVRIWLEDTEGRTAATREARLGDGVPVTAWKPGQYIRNWPAVRVPANVADGKYTVKLAAARGSDLLGWGPSWLPFGTTIAQLGQIEVKGRPHVTTAPDVQHPFEATFGQKVRLLGYDLAYDPADQTLKITLYWKALALMDTSYTVFVHLLNTQGQIIGAGDAIPADGEMPTTGWIEDEFITDAHTLALPPGLSPGGYPIEVGVYDAASGARLKMTDGKDHVVVGSFNTP